MSDGGDLYDAEMGDDVTGGNVQFDYGQPGNTHHSIYGDGGHYSWDDEDRNDPNYDPYGPNDSIHGTDHADGGHW